MSVGTENPAAPPAAPAPTTLFAPGPVPVPAQPPHSPAPIVVNMPPSPVPATDPNTLSVPRAFYDDLMERRDRLARLEAEQETVRRKLEDEKAQALLEAGKLKEGMETLRGNYEKQIQEEKSKLAATDSRIRSYVKENALMAALSEYELSSPAAPHFIRQALDAQLEVHQDGDKLVARTAGFVSAKELLKEFLSRDENKIFIRAKSQPGSGGTNQDNPGQTPPQPTNAPPSQDQQKTLGDNMIDVLGAFPGGGHATPPPNVAPANRNMNLPFALHAKR